MKNKIDWTRINNDVNGNPRYVCHFLNFCKDTDPMECGSWGHNSLSFKYQTALNRAKTLGGKKFHNKQYGGGIAFQCYSIPDLEEHIFELLAK